MEYDQSFRYSSMASYETKCDQAPTRRASDRERLRTQLLALGLSLMTSISGLTQACCQSCGTIIEVKGDFEEEELIEEILAYHDGKSRCVQPRMRHNASLHPKPNQGIGMIGDRLCHDLVCETDPGDMDGDSVVTDCAMYSPPTISTPRVAHSATPPKPSHGAGYHPSNALYSVFANRIKRAESLWACSKTMGFSVDEAAEAGFVHLPTQRMSDVVCFYCGVEVKLLRHDDAWIEHAQANPFCEFVKREKGDEFINLVTDIRDEESTPTPSFLVPERAPPATSPSPTRFASQDQWQSTPQMPSAQPMRQPVREVDRKAIQARLDRDECQLIIKMGFSRQLLGQVIAEQLTYNGDDFKSFMDMYKAVESAAEALNMK